MPDLQAVLPNATDIVLPFLSRSLQHLGKGGKKFILKLRQANTLVRLRRPGLPQAILLRWWSERKADITPRLILARGDLLTPWL